MNKPILITALAISAALSLPATASARSFKETIVEHGDYRREGNVRPIHYEERRYREAHHHGHRGHHRHAHRHDHRVVERYYDRPVERYDYRPVERYDYRTVERYEPRHDGDVRVRISYDLHL